MAGDHINQGGEGLGDDFFEQMLSVPYSGGGGGGGGGEAVNYIGGGGGGPDHHQHQNQNQNHVSPMFLGLGHGGGGELGSSSQHHTLGIGGGGVGFRSTTSLPLGLNLDPNVANTTASFLKPHHHQDVGKHFGARDGDANPSPSSSSSRIHENDPIHLTSLFPAFGHLQSQPQLRPSPPQVHLHQPFQGQAAPGSAPSGAASHPPPIRPRVRARRGQATDPHSIAERLRRERIAERMKALQELVPSCNKTDRAVMLDEIVDYVKFLRLQVKVLSMSRLGGAGAVAQLVADVPQPSAEGDSGIEGGLPPAAWERWSNDGTEEQVAKLMEEDIGAAMQFLQSKELCIMPISLASAFFRSHQQDTSSVMKPESNNPL